LEHILFQCTQTGQDQVWPMVHNFLAKKHCDVELDLGTVLGCASARLQGRKDSRDKPLERAFRIMVSESAFLIWKLRCEKRVGHADDADWKHAPAEVIARWGAMIRARVALDKRLTNGYKYNRRAVDPSLHKETWQ
ncbi:hypothetical protein AURDEDRAFT_27593, partial [Auricularia subglabra TFB-10046 SS5]